MIPYQMGYGKSNKKNFPIIKKNISKKLNPLITKSITRTQQNLNPHNWQASTRK